MGRSDLSSLLTSSSPTQRCPSPFLSVPIWLSPAQLTATLPLGSHSTSSSLSCGSTTQGDVPFTQLTVTTAAHGFSPRSSAGNVRLPSSSSGSIFRIYL
ncbi:hypothetical protein PIB30_044015 [Stylosanthes scabra]|uniref:Uncharacterized protein n=1 Tax=Stylosanthes scabra TaxID=79078 RepID=A0ABU6XHD7_9FABA|nr:hypothetical protein [Stylosanthes scabra]